MQIKTITTYNFEELTEEAQERAIQKFRERQDLWFLEDDLQMQFKEIAEEQGFTNVQFQWSLNGSGDYVCFSARILNDTFFKKHGIYLNTKYSRARTEYCAVYVNIVHDCSSVTVSTETYSEEWDEFKDFVQKIVDNICEKCQKIGHEAYDYETSDENIKETLIISECQFLENGDKV